MDTFLYPTGAPAMKRALLIVCLFTFLIPALPGEADAFWWMFRRRRTRSSYSVSSQVQAGTPYQVCLQKAQIMARRGRVFHPGGSFAGCRYEGVGGGRTAQAALANCCYSGARGSKGPARTPVASAVVQSSSGWFYACRLYN